MFRDEFTAVTNATNPDDLLREVVLFTRWLGFETVTAIVVADRPCGETEFLSVHNAPASYLELLDDFEGGRCDPVMQHCKRSSVPIAWDRGTYVCAGQSHKWEEQSRHGYCTGVALALHLPRGYHFFVGVDRDRPLPANSAEVTRLTADLHLFASVAHEVAMRVLLPEFREAASLKLSRRELETLHWTMEGKTAWELGRILGISEQTAARHVNSAAHKLDCVNKHHAVAKALRLGLIW